MTESLEVLRLWLRGEGLRGITQLAAPDRKTIRRYVRAAEALAGCAAAAGPRHPYDLPVYSVPAP